MASRILFIDDDQAIIEFYKILFSSNSHEAIPSTADQTHRLADLTRKERSAHTIFTAPQGEEGVQLIEQQIAINAPVEIVFIDMHMPPGIDGIETALKIRQIAPRIEIVLVTAYSDRDLPVALKKMNRIDKLLYIKKPFSALEIIQMVNNLSEKISLQKASERFLTNITHELKTPLTSILGFSSILSQSSLPSDLLEMAKIVHKASQQIEMLLNDLIDAAQFQERRISLNCFETNIQELISEVLINFQDARPDLIKTELLDALPVINIDRTRVKQCLSNLLSNAIKFSAPTSSIVIKAWVDNHTLFIAVTDKGIGIEQEEQKRIFRRFYRVEDSHHHLEGMGLGLSIALQIAELHGGTIRCQSHLGEGSCFTLCLPLS